jgi:hypothetical protein
VGPTVWAAPSHEVVTAALLQAMDRRSTLGKNIAMVEEENGQNVWTASPDLVPEDA